MGHSSVNVRCTYLRGLELPELKEENIPKKVRINLRTFFIKCICVLNKVFISALTLVFRFYLLQIIKPAGGQ